jgi:hypothetical protein
MDIKQKVGVKGGQGNAASEFSDIVARAGSWQYGRDAQYEAVGDEQAEEDNAFGGLNDWKGRDEEEHDPGGIQGGK